MIEFGKTLREAREAKGYSVSQLAEVTHILPQIIENLEREDFTKIVAPIYGRGFVKLYCEHVGIDPKPLVEEFMDIYTGNRPPVIRLKEVEVAGGSEAQVEVAKPEPANEEPAGEAPVEVAEPPPASEPPAFDFEAKDEPPPVANDLFSKPLSHAEPFKPGPDDLPFPEDAPQPKRDYRMPGYAMPDVPRSFWRFGILGLAAIGVVALGFFGCRALYRATMGTGGCGQAAECRSGEVVAAKDAKGGDAAAKPADGKPETRNAKREARSAPRKGVKVPPLYID